LLCAALVSSFGVFAVLAMFMPTLWAFTLCIAAAQTLSAAGFAVVYPVVAAVVPYQLRSQGFAMIGVYIFLFGAFFGAILAGWISDAWGEQVAVALVALPSSVIGGWLIGRGALHVEHDVANVVRDLEEERQEIQRIHGGEERALLQVRHVDFSYGSVQVLFDVDLEVRRGEALALLGTNGAGKSTLLNVISGLAIPSRGTVRLDGRTIGFSTAEARVGMGIVHVSGGRAVFDPLTVRENLEIGAFPIRRRGDAFVQERIDASLEHFPVLAGRLDTCAGDLSGGLQQQLALAKALVLEPEILLIDELSLGLAPVVVAELIEVLERLKASGLTLVIVEQSVNVALELADRAVFMEKGQVRFEGEARELLERDDLLRAVFLGREGG
jgi:ABC-type branched-subunit amino acid transport system ATPase component